MGDNGNMYVPKELLHMYTQPELILPKNTKGTYTVLLTSRQNWRFLHLKNGWN